MYTKPMLLYPRNRRRPADRFIVTIAISEVDLVGSVNDIIH